MAEREVRFCTTEDGVRIAYCVEGEGPPLLVTPFVMESFALEHLVPQWERFFQLLKESLQLVRYDMRGAGLSEPGAHDIGPAAFGRDLEAVVQAAGLRRFGLLAWGMYGPVGIEYAARHQREVQALALYCTYSRGLDVVTEKAGRSLAELARANWSLAVRAIADLSSRREFGEAGLAMARWYRESTTGETCAQLWEAWTETDVSDQLGQIRCPTLVVHPRDDRAWRPALGQRLAAAIPEARLVTVAGGFHAAAFAHADETVTIIRNFIVEFLGDPADEPQEPVIPSGMAVILFLDIADSTALTTKLGDAAYRERERKLDTSLRAAIRDSGGTPVEGKVLGDGVMAVFTSARQAIDAAQRCRDLGNEAGLPLHLGIHAGDVVREVDSDGRANVHGGAVQVAARVQSAAAPGEILVSATVRDLARTSAGVEFEDRGEHELKGIAEPQRLFAVRAEGSPKETAG